MVSKTALGIAAGICGTLFVGYCIYFDRKRRSDPNFKRKLRERRKNKKAAGSVKAKTKLPDLNDPESVQKFFLHEVKAGDVELHEGNINEAVEHLCNAVAVCGQAEQLLSVLQQQLPPEVFLAVLQKLPETGMRLKAAHQAATNASPLARGPELLLSDLDELE